MIIKRELQKVTWLFDTEHNILIIQQTDREEGEEPRRVTLNKVEIFSLSRFLTRTFQNMSKKNRKRKEVKENAV